MLFRNQNWAMICCTALLAAMHLFAPNLVSAQSKSLRPPTSADEVAGDAADASLSNSERQTLKYVFKRSIQNCQLRLPQQHAITTFKQLMKQTLRAGQTTDALKTQWQQQGWALTHLPQSNVVVIHESPSQHHGRGIYIIRMNTRSAIVLQAPHRFSDVHTGVIARKMFEQNAVAALGLNTVHRNELDLAHTDQHYFNAFTEAVLEALDHALIVQLHGFKTETKTHTIKTAQMIVSDATRFPGRTAREVVAEFKSAFGAGHTLLYGVETRWLGGTKNQQAATAHHLGFPQFIHLEMTRDFRKQLVNSAALRQQFITTLSEVAEAK